MKVSEKFEALLEAYRHPDGRRWNGRELEDATGGVVTRSYVSALRKDVIASPGYEKLRAIARAMGFRPEVWFEEEIPVPPAAGNGEKKDVGLSGRLEQLFDAVIDEKKGRPYSNAEVARMSLGGLTEEEVAGIRSGEVTNPTLDQILALAEVFGVSPSYFTEKEAPLLDREVMSVLADKDASAVVHRTLMLSGGEKKMVLDLLDNLGHLRGGKGNEVT